MGPLYKKVSRIVFRTTKPHSASGSGGLTTFEMLVTSHPMTHHILDDSNVQEHHYQNLISNSLKVISCHDV
jgi:hypothetical protein